MRHAITAAAALLTAACGGQGERGEEAGGEAATDSATAAVAFQPGEWEITTQVLGISVAGMPDGANMPLPPPSTIRTCMTPEQAGQPNAGFLSGSGESGDCTFRNNTMAGGRIQANVQCEADGGTMNSTMTGRFTPTSFEVDQQVETAAQGTTMNMESRTSGRRIGDCPS